MQIEIDFDKATPSGNRVIYKMTFLPLEKNWARKRADVFQKSSKRSPEEKRQQR